LLRIFVYQQPVRLPVMTIGGKPSYPSGGSGHAPALSTNALPDSCGEAACAGTESAISTPAVDMTTNASRRVFLSTVFLRLRYRASLVIPSCLSLSQEAGGLVAERMSLGARVATTIRAGRTVKVMRAVMVRRMVPPRDDTNPQSDVRHMETG